MAMSNLNRRQFLQKLGATAAGGWTIGVWGIPFARGAQPPDVSLPGGFGRMFRLPPFAPPTRAVREALLELGKAGGIMDAKDDLAAGPVELIVDPQLNLVNRNSSSHTAGVTFFGQFLDHDVTFDARSRLGFPSQPIKSSNTRTPFLDLAPSTRVVRRERRNSTIRLIRSSLSLKTAVCSKICREIRARRPRL